MKKDLTFKETQAITSMLFGLFFGAGNLIFPAMMGQQAGWNVLPALAGFLVTGVGLPLLSVVSLGITGSNGLSDLAGLVGEKFKYVFTAALYLTIGPFFAAPRCVTVPFEAGVRPFLKEGTDAKLALFLFSSAFFLLILLFSLRPGKILTIIGKILNPIFMIVLGILVITAVMNAVSIRHFTPAVEYQNFAFFKGLLDGYNTMDTLAGLAFGIIVVTVIRDLGITDQKDIARNTIKAGISSCSLMAVIYLLVALTGTFSLSYMEVQDNGTAVLSGAALHFFTSAGQILFALIVFLACLKTVIGLITSCATTFAGMIREKISYKAWVLIFSLITFGITNLGLKSIIKISIPVLSMLYPIAITLTLLAIFGSCYEKDSTVIHATMTMAVLSSIFDFLHALPAEWISAIHLDGMMFVLERKMPFFALGFGWLLPTCLGFFIGLLIRKFLYESKGS